jgi:hypothetical protein
MKRINFTARSTRSPGPALVLALASTLVLGACDDDDDNKGKADASTDTSRADASPTDAGAAETHADVAHADGPSDAPEVQDFGVADLVFADTVTASDAGVKGACVSESQFLCYEFEPDYTDVGIANHCSPMMATSVAVCPAEFMGARIGRCVTKSTFGTLHTVYYKRVDPRSAQVMCASKGGTWYAQ